MKKIFFFALASLALASCSQDEEFVAENNNSGSSNRANSGVVSFSTYNAANTRAGIVTSADLKGTNATSTYTKGFNVAARYNGKKYFADNALFEIGLKIDDNDKVTGAFDTEADTYWWPSFSAGNIEFRAFNHVTPEAVWTDETTDATSYQKIKWDVPATAEDQQDLVVAYADVAKKPMAADGAIADGVQPLNFVHALSKINFTFKGENENYKYTINKVEVIAAGKALNAGAAETPVMSFAKTTEITTKSDGAGGTVNKTDGDQSDNTQSSCVSWNVNPITTDPIFDGSLGATKTGDLNQKQSILYTYYSDATGVSNTLADPANAVSADAKIALEDQNMMLLPQDGRVAIRVYYKVEDKNGKLIGNCGYEETDFYGFHKSDVSNYNDDQGAILGCKTVVINLGADNDDSATSALIPAWEAGKAYRFTMTLPTDNFIGDLSKDNVPDGLDSTGASDVDLDGDNDTDPSEFDKLTPIRFSVTVSNWETESTASNITIK